jgi:hypothetical protein
MDCEICCEKFNKSSNLRVECKGCQEDHFACRKCCQNFILTTAQQDPCCMFCRTPWEREFMNEYLTKKFVNKDLKKYSENLFLERQVSLLPATQEYAVREKKVREINERIKECETECNRLKKALIDQKQLINALTIQRERTRLGTDPEEETATNFCMKCPDNNCNGFLNTRSKCGLCEVKFCSQCLEPKTEDHECNEEIKASVQAIKKEAKPRPCCGEMISKIDGCDQMWCVKCHVQFSWRTGKKLEGYNHNPEYFRWLRESGQNIQRNPDDLQVVNECGMVMTARGLQTKLNRFFVPYCESIKSVHNIYACFRHVEWHLNNDNNERYIETQLRYLRVKFLLKEIDQERWKTNIQRIDKSNKKNNSILNIKRLMVEVLRSYIERVVMHCDEADNKTIENIQKIIKESETFRNYLNGCFLKVSTNFDNCAVPGIGLTWREIPNYVDYMKKMTKTSQKQMKNS